MPEQGPDPAAGPRTEPSCGKVIVRVLVAVFVILAIAWLVWAYKVSKSDDFFPGGM